MKSQYHSQQYHQHQHHQLNDFAPTDSMSGSAACPTALLIQNGTVVNHDSQFRADVYIEQGVIKSVGLNLTVPARVKTIDASGKLIIPGGIDPSTHLEAVVCGTRTADDFYTGTRAALAGGTTTIMNLVSSSSSSEQGTSLLDALEQSKKRAAERACCDYAFHVAVKGYSEQIASEMQVMAKEKGINSFQMYMSGSGAVNDASMIKLMRKCKELGALAMCHCENGELIEQEAQRIAALGIHGPEGHLLSRPEAYEAEATQRAITVAGAVNCPLYVSPVMSKSTALAIGAARRKGQVVIGEPIAASLGTDGTHIFNKCWVHSAGHLMSPPLRDDPATPQLLQDMLANGELELAGSAHCAFNTEQKALGKHHFGQIPPGVNGCEARLSVIWDRCVATGKMDACRFVACTSTQAAKLFNLYPQKGRCEVGSDADLCVWNAQAKRTVSARTHEQACDFNIFEGMPLQGVAEVVIARGKVVYEQGQLSAEAGSGRLLSTPCFADCVYRRTQQRDKLRPAGVEREAYTGPVCDLSKKLDDLSVAAAASKAKAAKGGAMVAALEDSLHARPLTKSGFRNMQDSSFSISGEWEQPHRNSTRVRAPPGGQSSVIF